MSNLRNFISYKKDCPVCGNSLHLSFNSDEKNKNYRYEGNSLYVRMEVIKFPMSPTKKISFDVNFNIDLDTNEFTIDFLDISKNKLSYVSLDKINSFKNYILSKNTNFYKSCDSCHNYMYSATPVFNYNSLTKITDFTICFESIKLNEDNKIYNLINNYKSGESVLYFGKQSLGKLPPKKLPGLIETSIIKMDFTNKKDFVKRLDCIVTFS